MFFLPFSKELVQGDLLLDRPDGHGCPRGGLNREKLLAAGGLMSAGYSYLINALSPACIKAVKWMCAVSGK